MKTKKSITSRIKITKGGKLLRRPMGQRHFKAKYSSKSRRKKKGLIEISKVDKNLLKRYSKF